MVQLARMPTQSKPHIIQPYPTLGTTVGSVVLGREGRREVMGTVGSLGRVPIPLTVHYQGFF